MVLKRIEAWAIVKKQWIRKNCWISKSSLEDEVTRCDVKLCDVKYINFGGQFHDKASDRLFWIYLSNNTYFSFINLVYKLVKFVTVKVLSKNFEEEVNKRIQVDWAAFGKLRRVFVSSITSMSESSILETLISLKCFVAYDYLNLYL